MPGDQSEVSRKLSPCCHILAAVVELGCTPLQTIRAGMMQDDLLQLVCRKEVGVPKTPLIFILRPYRRKIIIRADMLLCRVLCALDRLTGVHRQVRNRSARRT